jgi:DNA repair photolyase
VRWESQRVDGDAAQQPLPGIAGLVRTVRAPEFSGMVFHEVLARSVLNKVSPAASSLPFDWTVNPYRGCGHACTYCMVGETPILLADGRTRPLADLRVGDRIYGTVRDGDRRRFAVTTVRDHWSTRKPAYRVTLDDGTQLVTSGDHRLLSESGWRYVAGRRRRAQLVEGIALVGTGRFAGPPKPTPDYRLGYLCGVVRGGGQLSPSGTIHQPGPGLGGVRRVRAAVAEYEALSRTREYLSAAGIPSDRFHGERRRDRHGDQLGHRLGAEPADPAGHRREVLAIHSGRVGDLAAVVALIRWPTVPSACWRRGFLAGAFDAEGEHHGDAITIASADAEVIGHVVAACRQFGFDAQIDGRRDDAMLSVRLRGGVAERLRFFHTVDPAVTRKRSVDGLVVSADPRLRVHSVEPLDMEVPLFDISTGTGDFIADGVVSHNCFARASHTYLDLDAGADFDSQVVVKVNAAEVLARQVRSPRWARRPVAMGTNTDPYQRAEGRYALMPGIIDALAGSGTPLSVLTKGTLLGRDLPQLVDASERVPVGLGVSVAMIDRGLSASVEPGAPSPQARLGLVRRIVDAGLGCHVMVAPVLPGLTDGMEQLDSLLGEVAAAGAGGATVLALHLRPGAREWYRAWLAREHPDLVPRYDRVYAGGSYADRRYRAWLARRVGPLLRRHGLHRPAPGHNAPAPPVGPPPTGGAVPVPPDGAAAGAHRRGSDRSSLGAAGGRWRPAGGGTGGGDARGSPWAAEQLTLL